MKGQDNNENFFACKKLRVAESIKIFLVHSGLEELYNKRN